MRELIVDGVPLRDPLGQWFIDYTRSTFFSTISRRFESEAAVGFNGVATAKDTYFTSGQGTIVLNVQGSTPEEFNRNVTALQSLFNQNSYLVVSAAQGTRLNGDFLDDIRVRSNRSFVAGLANQREGISRSVGSLALERIGPRAGRLTIIMERPASFWIARSYETLELHEGSNDLSPITKDSTAPITRARLRIKGPFTSGGYYLIRDQGRTDKFVQISPGPGFTADKYLLVYLDTMQAWIQESDSWSRVSGATDARSALTTVGSGSFSLEPKTTLANFPLISNTYSLQVESVGMTLTGTNPASAFLYVRRCYLS